ARAGVTGRASGGRPRPGLVMVRLRQHAIYFVSGAVHRRDMARVAQEGEAADGPGAGRPQHHIYCDVWTPTSLYLRIPSQLDGTAERNDGLSRPPQQVRAECERA